MRVPSGLSEPRNDALFPPHGNTFGAANHAGSGLAVGRNGVCVFEHGASYFAPVLVHAVPLEDWTHIAVVYRGAQPSLYLNGELVHTGLKSTYTVHPGTAAGGGGRSFPGRTGRRGNDAPRAERSGNRCAHAVDASSGRAPAGQPPSNCHAMPQAAFPVLAWQPGQYTLGRADGTNAPLAWMRFPNRWTSPARGRCSSIRAGVDPNAVFAELCDWTQRAEEGIRHYSGTATYRKTFALAGTTQADVSGSISARCATWPSCGSTAIRSARSGSRRGAWRSRTQCVRATTCWRWTSSIPWNNRLVGDLALPPEQRRTYLALPLPAGTRRCCRPACSALCGSNPPRKSRWNDHCGARQCTRGSAPQPRRLCPRSRSARRALQSLPCEVCCNATRLVCSA